WRIAAVRAPAEYDPDADVPWDRMTPSGMSGLLDLSAFRATPVVRDPFDHLVVRGLVVADARAAVLDDFPAFTETGNVPVTALSYGSSFRALVDELQSPALNEILSEKFGMALLACPMLVTVGGRSGRDDGFVHTDAWWKLATLLVYLNDDWSAPGGCLRLLRSPDLDDCAVEVPPAWGTAVMFRRS